VDVSLSIKIEKPSTLEYGTIGLLLKKDGYKYVCTNAHVLMMDKIEGGETSFFRPVEQQYQPDVNLYDQSGQVFHGYLQEGIFGGIDAAICRLEDESSINNTIPGFGVPTGIRIVDGRPALQLVSSWMHQLLEISLDQRVSEVLCLLFRFAHRTRYSN
jgi:hypothetical protein